MAYTPTTWTNGSGQPVSADNLNKMEQGIVDATGPGKLLFDYTAADLVLDGVSPANNYNFWEFDLTGLDAPSTGYRMCGSFSHTANITIPDETIYIDINEGAVTDPYNNGSWDSSGYSLMQGSVSAGIDPSPTQMLLKTGIDMVNIRGLEVIQDFCPKQFGTSDFCFGDGFWSMIDSSGAIWISRATKSQILATTFLDGTLKHIRWFNPIQNAGSYDLQTNPLTVCSMKLYAI